ncbi:MAG: SatD family protein [Pleomorphochaeta sp.]
MEISQNENLIAIIGDIIDSKQIPIDKRNLYQDKLKKVLSQINKVYESEIISNFIITLGDEFQGVIKNASHLFEIIEMIEIAMEPVELRFGIGVGILLTEIDRKASLGSDGPAYHRARKSITLLKNNKDNIQNILIDSSNTIFDKEINSHLYWVCRTYNTWSMLQRKIVKYKMYDKTLTQKEIAKNLDIDQSLVSRTLKASLYDNYFNSKQSISLLVEKVRSSEC